jgi:hypothetical protein
VGNAICPPPSPGHSHSESVSLGPGPCPRRWCAGSSGLSTMACALQSAHAASVGWMVHNLLCSRVRAGVLPVGRDMPWAHEGQQSRCMVFLFASLFSALMPRHVRRSGGFSDTGDHTSPSRVCRHDGVHAQRELFPSKAQRCRRSTVRTASTCSSLKTSSVSAVGIPWRTSRTSTSSAP